MKKRRFLPLIGVALFVYILSTLDLSQTFGMLMDSRLEFVLAAILLTIPVTILKGFKWKVIIKFYGIDYPVLKASAGWLMGFFYGIITPGRVGELARVRYLKEDSGISLGKSLTTVVVDRIIDIVTLFSLSFFGLVMTVSGMAGAGGIMAYITVFFGVFLAAVFLLTRKDVVRAVFGPPARRACK